MRTPDSISVALCTFDGERYVREQLQSILGQTRPPDELVVADGGSSDSTLSIVESTLAQASPRTCTRVLGADGRRWDVRENFQRAIEAATGSVIVLSDQDDRWQRSRLEDGYAELVKEPRRLLVAHDASLVDEDAVPKGSSLFGSMGVTPDELAVLNSERAMDALVRRNVLAGMGFMFRRELLSRAMPIPPGWMHDYWLACIAAARSGLAVVDDSSLLLYRQHSANVVGAGSNRLRTRARRLLSYSDDPGARREMFDQLDRRLRGDGAVAPATAAAVAGKMRFERQRSALPRRRAQRLAGVLKIARERGYAMYASNGNWNAVRDLLVDWDGGEA